MRPFSTLGVKPFLLADALALAALQSEFHKLSRQFHPDRFINRSEAERATAESKSSELNFDYALLRDTWKLVDEVLREPAGPAKAERSAPPPELAEEYFELQEAWMEKGPTPETLERVNVFVSTIQDMLLGSEDAVLALAKRFPYQGPGDAATPWSPSDLEVLRKAVHRLRYYRSFERDIRSKFLNSGL